MTYCVNDSELEAIANLTDKIGVLQELLDEIKDVEYYYRVRYYVEGRFGIELNDLVSPK